MGYRTGGIQNRRDKRQLGYWKRRFAGKGGCRTGGCRTGGCRTSGDAGQVAMQDRWDAGQLGCRTGWMQDRWEADRWDARQVGRCRAGRMQDNWAGGQG